METVERCPPAATFVFPDAAHIPFQSRQTHRKFQRARNGGPQRTIDAAILSYDWVTTIIFFFLIAVAILWAP
jgi:hypothetical protein